MAGKEPDFSGWASVNDQKCTDGRTIKSGAFRHMDKAKVPLVWQHQHSDPMSVLGHAILEHRAFGVYTHGYFNETEQGISAKKQVAHGDITSLSIYANNLTERSVRGGREVYHGDIKEVSLVLAGANPGAVIENINIVHGGVIDELESEAVIFNEQSIVLGDDLAHDDMNSEGENNMTDEENLEHADDRTVADVFNSMTEEQKNVVYYMVGEALGDENGADEKDAAAQHGEELSVEDFLAHIDNKINEGFSEMARHNVFETHGSGDAGKSEPTLSHAQIKTIFADAQKEGSLKDSVLAHAGDYGIDNIDVLFPDAKSVMNSPELIARRMEWVASVLADTKHSPFSRIKSFAADLTADEARAKGYVKGNMKKDEVIKLLKRVTTPTTIYKKQKLDRDDIVDITDLDVVAWLKAEMRLMLDEEIARAILIGDGREPDDEDKIDEDHIRPIAFDHDMYAHKITLAAETTANDVVEAILRARKNYKGTGQPTLYTTDDVLTDLILQKDKVGRRLYETEESLAAALRVKKIVTVEVMEDTPEILAIIVNLTDYTVGADKGGQVSMFDDFDIDYNQQKYLIETRISGALTKPKSALVIRKSLGNVVTPEQPLYNAGTKVITIPNQVGVVYSIDGVTKNAGELPAITESTTVEATPAPGYSFPHNTDADWYFVV